MIDLFPPHERMQQVQAMLAGTLKGIVGQRLMRTSDGAGRVAGLWGHDGYRAHNETSSRTPGQIQTAISEGEYEGM